MDLWALRGHPQVLLKQKMPMKVADIWVSTEVEFQVQHLTNKYSNCAINRRFQLVAAPLTFKLKSIFYAFFMQ